MDSITIDSSVVNKIYKMHSIYYFANEDELINRTITSFKSHNKNFGLVLKGLKGTGKTVTAKQICNKLNLPVILVTTHFQNISE